MTGMDEHKLVSEIQRGSAEAVERFVRHYQPQVYLLAVRLTGNKTEAKDLAQDVFIKAWKSVNNFRGDASLSTWLYKITVNTWIDSQRKNTLPTHSIHQENEDGVIVEPVDESATNNPETALEAGQISAHIDLALNKLSSREKTAFVLKHYRQLSITEVGQVMGVEAGTVKSLLFRGIKKLQQALYYYKSELGLED